MSRYDKWGYGFPEYVPVAEKKANNKKMAEKLKKKNANLSPIIVEGRNIAKTFWGKAWCKHIESFHDYSNRLPRGRSYLRNGAVLDLQIQLGKITALVAGSSRKPYEISIKITPITEEMKQHIIQLCMGKIDSIFALLQGKISEEIINVLCDKKEGIFPHRDDIDLNCSCPDWSILCKHLAAVLYGIGAKLDEEPLLLFTLRGINENELISSATIDNITAELADEIDESSISEIFGIEFDNLDSFDSVVKVDKKSVESPILIKNYNPCFHNSKKWKKGAVSKIRRLLKMTTNEFAEELGISYTTLLSYENGKKAVPKKIKEKILTLT